MDEIFKKYGSGLMNIFFMKRAKIVIGLILIVDTL